MSNKKGQLGIVLFFGMLILILIVGFVLALTLGVINFASDEITPVMKDLGMVNGANLSHAGEITFGVADTAITSLNWIIGIAYMAALLFSVIFGLVSSKNSHPLFIGFYFALMFLLIIFCIIISNSYEEFYQGQDDIALRLQEQTLISYLILHSPIVMAIIALITGVFLFTRQDEGGFEI